MAISRDGIVDLRTAKAAGLTERVIAGRVRRGFLVRDGRGVFRIAGAERAGRTAERAALAITRGRALGLWSANAAFGVSKGVTPSKVHVMVPRTGSRADKSWYQTHPTRRVLDDEFAMRNGLPVTAMARGLRDFAAFLPPKPWADLQLSRWTEEALILGRLTLPKLELMIERERASRVAARLVRVLDYHRGQDPQIFRSIGETWLRDLIERRSLPMPLFNCRAAGGKLAEADAYWVKEGLIVEFDGFTYHHTATKHNRDRRRDRIAKRHGISTVRITRDDFENDLPDLELDIERFVLGLPPV